LHVNTKIRHSTDLNKLLKRNLKMESHIITLKNDFFKNEKYYEQICNIISKCKKVKLYDTKTEPKITNEQILDLTKYGNCNIYYIINRK